MKKNQKKILLAIMIITAISGCNKNRFHVKGINETQFFKKEIALSQHIVENYNPLFLKIFSYNKTGEEFIVYYNEMERTINFYTLEDTIVRKKISIEKHKTLIDFCVINLDSIYVLSKNNMLSIYASNTTSQYKIQDSVPVFHNNYSLSSFYEYPISIINNNLLIYSFPDKPLNSDARLMEYFQTQRDVHLKISKAKASITNLSGIYPKYFSENNFYVYSPIRTIGKNNLIIYSFPSSDEIYAYDSEEKKYAMIRLQTHNFDKNEYFIKDKVSDYNYIAKYLTENDRFGVLAYSHSQKKYLRILTHAMPFENTDGTINKFTNKSFSILIYDDEFSLEKEITFPSNEYDLRNVYLTKNYFLLIKKDENKISALAAYSLN